MGSASDHRDLEPQQQQPCKPSSTTRIRAGKAHDLLLCLGYDWQHLSDIHRRVGTKRQQTVSVMLNTLKKKGLVERGTRGMWRKKIANGHDGAEVQHALV